MITFRMMSLIALRSLPVLGLLIALAACSSADSARTNFASESLSPPPTTRAWRSDDGTTRRLLLIVFEDGSAELHTRGPAESVPHWGELRYPEKAEFARLHRVGDRNFLVFDGEYAHVAEMAERSGDHLVVWFHRGLDPKADIEAQLRALPAIKRAPDLELTLLPAPDPRDKPANPPLPATRFAI